jgi:hypothetical protein
MSDRIPESYKQASWRNTLPVDEGRLGLAFSLSDGEIIRLNLDVESARHLVETVSFYLDQDTARLESTEGPTEVHTP